MGDEGEDPAAEAPPGEVARDERAEDACLDCGAELTGRFCSACGQRRIDGPLRTTEIAGDLWSHVVDLDRGFLHTFVGLTLRPGTTAREYVDGKRKRHTPPFRYFLILTAAWFAFPSLIGFDYADYVARSMEEARAAIERSPPVFVSALRRFMDASVEMYEFRRWTILANLPLYALGGLLLFRRRRRTFAEWFAFSLYVTGHGLLLGIVGFVLLAFELDTTYQFVSFLVLPYMIWAYRGFSGDGTGMATLKGLAVFFIGGTVLFCGLFGIAFALTG